MHGERTLKHNFLRPTPLFAPFLKMIDYELASQINLLSELTCQPPPSASLPPLSAKDGLASSLMHSEGRCDLVVPPRWVRADYDTSDYPTSIKTANNKTLTLFHRLVLRILYTNSLIRRLSYSLKPLTS